MKEEHNKFKTWKNKQSELDKIKLNEAENIFEESLKHIEKSLECNSNKMKKTLIAEILGYDIKELKNQYNFHFDWQKKRNNGKWRNIKKIPNTSNHLDVTNMFNDLNNCYFIKVCIHVTKKDIDMDSAIKDSSPDYFKNSFNLKSEIYNLQELASNKINNISTNSIMQSQEQYAESILQPFYSEKYIHNLNKIPPIGFLANQSNEQQDEEPNCSVFPFLLAKKQEKDNNKILTIYYAVETIKDVKMNMELIWDYTAKFCINE
jgi:hypothetical protein